jgi:hypothetical protein
MGSEWLNLFIDHNAVPAHVRPWLAPGPRSGRSSTPSPWGRMRFLHDRCMFPQAFTTFVHVALARWSTNWGKNDLYVKLSAADGLFADSSYLYHVGNFATVAKHFEAGFVVFHVSLEIPILSCVSLRILLVGWKDWTDRTDGQIWSDRIGRLDGPTDRTEWTALLEQPSVTIFPQSGFACRGSHGFG